MKKVKLKIENKGIASLPAIVLLAGVIVELGIAGALLTFYLNNTIYASRLSNEALLAAQTGIADATSKIVHDKSCPNASCPSSYTLSVGEGSADVTICKDTCAGVGKHQITAIGRSAAKEHTLVAVLAVNSTTGKVTTESIKELVQ